MTLNSYFNSKPAIIKLINILSVEENAIFKEYTKTVIEGYLQREEKLALSIKCLIYHILLKRIMK